MEQLGVGELSVLQLKYQIGGGTGHISPASSIVDLPNSFIPLPGPGPASQWGYYIIKVHTLVSNSYDHMLQFLRREDGDAFRIRYHMERLQGQFFKLYKRLRGTSLPSPWLKNGAKILGTLLVELEKVAGSTESEQQTDWIKPTLFLAPEATGSQGRPQKQINKIWLQDALSHEHCIPMKKVADVLGIHQNTLCYKLKQLYLSR
ncbi:hypothetical protein M422DRAFT_248196 [Sphaerobolus stellatus SS14]|uniref:Uncharacterized protein n=1 Tax=Sphaerobolus stellatus (strain SS14) TaxID=990650 RepID=A0A0C9VWA2_SPHS4|nr:hypothetical protein M422DRAFT_248196 [Sphaerobolus stellatus SS14]